MEPRTYCEQAAAELRGLQARQGLDREVAQRLVVLSYLTQWILPRVDTGAEFERELQRLSAHDSSAVGRAARAILLAWRDQAASSHRSSVALSQRPSRVPSHSGPAASSRSRS